MTETPDNVSAKRKAVADKGGKGHTSFKMPKGSTASGLRGKVSEWAMKVELEKVLLHSPLPEPLSSCSKKVGERPLLPYPIESALEADRDDVGAHDRTKLLKPHDLLADQVELLSSLL